MYGSDVVSSFGLAKGFTRPALSAAEVKCTLVDIIDAYVNLTAKRKLNCILRSHSHSYESVKTCDLVQVYTKNDNAKRGSWSSPRAVLAVDREGRFVTLPGRGKRPISAACEDTCFVFVYDSFSSIGQSATDELYGQVENTLDDTDSHDNLATEHGTHDTSKNDDGGNYKSNVCKSDCSSQKWPNMGERV